MKSEKEQQEIQNIIQKNSHKTTKFMICDRIFGAYIHCINEFSINNTDCEKICNLLENIKICNIRVR